MTRTQPIRLQKECLMCQFQHETFSNNYIVYTDLGSSIETFIVHMFLSKNPQFLPNEYETRSKLSTHEYFFCPCSIIIGLNLWIFK